MSYNLQLISAHITPQAVKALQAVIANETTEALTASKIAKLMLELQAIAATKHEVTPEALRALQERTSVTITESYTAFNTVQALKSLEALITKPQRQEETLPPVVPQEIPPSTSPQRISPSSSSSSEPISKQNPPAKRVPIKAEKPKKKHKPTFITDRLIQAIMTGDLEQTREFFKFERGSFNKDQIISFLTGGHVIKPEIRQELNDFFHMHTT